MKQNTKKSNWYDSLEPEIKDTVKLLRDNGYNTTNSCGHEMTIEVDIASMQEIENIAMCLIENGCKTFTILGHLEIQYEQYWRRYARIKFN